MLDREIDQLKAALQRGKLSTCARSRHGVDGRVWHTSYQGIVQVIN